MTALPVCLYDLIANDDNTFVTHFLDSIGFTFNERAREVIVKCGYIAMEEQGILIHCGDGRSEQAVMNSGERTTDLVAATGQHFLERLCKGGQLGVEHLVEDR